MKSKETRELTLAELEKKIRDWGGELMGLRLRKQTGQVEKPNMLKDLRRERARVLTILQEKRSEEEAAA